ncbi:MAG: hypothetical protein BWZ01_00744 [Deltaproteobacteria bacterium ADurb.BinA179]|jgi:hypothetical protein|nr:DUF4203 domain-containing protein [Deltaproteobacteria bacterium]MDI9541427.1 DUF4203 domain-containing protein [Pseudomonadota bacterium]NLW66747.1 TMEM198/TM7SF3 family protein [Bacteriovoracaceae bacterium]OPZ29196.1 MAG: hypothetical protein BWZ01_00744 [Deltaproteobacteria bacterium ADurb.BinA179]HRR21161.1 DUF4203 domain-containing protein [Desulfomonilia bacterium]
MVSLDTINILTGICLVMLGRRLYWLFVGLLGFLYALLIVPQFLHGQPGWVVVAAALGAGTLGGILAVFFQRLVIGFAGFFAGGYLAFSLLTLFHLASGRIVLIISAIVGALCAVLFAVFFDWSLIITSSLIGSVLITRSLHEGLAATVAIFAVLAVAGVVVQANVMQKGPGKGRS